MAAKSISIERRTRMKLYRTNEVDLLIEEDWKDESINAFVLPSMDRAGEAKSTLMISRDYDAGTDDINEYADAQLLKAAHDLHRYRFLGRYQVQLAAQRAVQVDFAWCGPEHIEIQERQIYLRYEDCFLVFTMCARAIDFQMYEDSWENALGSVRLRKY
jgi:hypothetical protein